MNHKTLNENQFLNSALTEENPLITTSKVMEWLKNRNEAINVEVTKIPFEQLDHWFLYKTNGMLKHSSGKFFSIEGLNVKTNWGNIE